MRRLLLALLLLPSIAFAQFPTTTVLDTFTGDADPIGGIWTDEVFGAGNGGCQKTSGYATKSGGTSLPGCYTTATYGADQEIYAMLPAPVGHSHNTALHFMGCLQSAGIGSALADGYAVRIQVSTGAANDRIGIYRIDNSVFTSISTTFTQELAAGDQVGMSIKADGSIVAYYKASAGSWTPVTSTTDTTYSCAGTHLGLNIRNTSHHVDDLGGGTFVPDEPDPPDPPPPAAEFPATDILETFTTNLNPIGAPWSATGFSGSGSCQRIGGLGKRSTVGGIGNETGCYISETFGASQEVYAELWETSTSSGTSHILFCLQAASVGTTNVDGYALRHVYVGAAPDTVGLYRLDGTGTLVYTLLGDAMTADVDSDGDALGARVLADGTMKAYFKDSANPWVELGERSSTTHGCAGSHIGLNIRVTTSAFDNFGGGTVSSTPPSVTSTGAYPLEFK